MFQSRSIVRRFTALLVQTKIKMHVFPQSAGLWLILSRRENQSILPLKGRLHFSTR